MASILTAILGLLILSGTCDAQPVPVRPAVSSGSAHVLVIREDGTVWGWGANKSGQLADGTLWSWGNNASGELGNGSKENGRVPAKVGASTRWRRVRTGGYFSFGIREDGSLF